jgi:hypothetical protein
MPTHLPPFHSCLMPSEVRTLSSEEALPSLSSCLLGSVRHPIYVTGCPCSFPAPSLHHSLPISLRRPLKLTGWELWLCGATNGPLFASDMNTTAFDGSEVKPEVGSVVTVGCYLQMATCMRFIGRNGSTARYILRGHRKQFPHFCPPAPGTNCRRSWPFVPTGSHPTLASQAGSETQASLSPAS